MRFKTIKDFPRYVVGSDGSVWRGVKKLKLRLRRGYLVVDLYGKDEASVTGVSRRTRYVHRLVAEAFLQPMPADKPQVGHLDGNPLNNVVSNLQWVCQSENEAHKSAHGTKTRGERHPAAKLTTEDVSNIRFDRKFLDFPVTAIAERYGVSPRQVLRICNGESRVAA